MAKTNNFTKKDLAQSLVDNETVGTMSLAQAIHAIDDLVASVTCALLRGEEITLRGFGTLRVVERKPKTCRNINAGTTVLVPACNTVKFIASKQLKKAVKNTVAR